MNRDEVAPVDVRAARAPDRRAATGRVAEDLAVDHLANAGYEILHRNWRRPEGELDIVARSPNQICVFVEVRSRTGDERGHPLEMVTPRKQRQVTRTARLFLQHESVDAIAYRFDVVGVTFAPEPAQKPGLVHIEGAFVVA